VIPHRGQLHRAPARRVRDRQRLRADHRQPDLRLPALSPTDGWTRAFRAGTGRDGKSTTILATSPSSGCGTTARTSGSSSRGSTAPRPGSRSASSCGSTSGATRF